MTVTYIYHSGFAVATGSAYLIFDCYTDPAGVVDKICERGDKPVYFFVSHRHQDHFNSFIFRYSGENVTYILSSDIKKALRNQINQNLLPSGVEFLKRGEVFEDALIHVEAMPSTDIGVSFCVKTGGKNIFHAGDLNLWHWKDESTDKEIKEAYGNYRAALRSIHDAGFDEFYLAMFPVDSRIGSDYEEGARIFVHDFKISHFIPMHFWDAPEKAADFKLYKNKDFGEYHALVEPSQYVEI